MLIDYISVEKLPWILVWLDWNLYAHQTSLIWSIIIFMPLYWIDTLNHAIFGLLLSIFVGFCAWVAYCAIRYGYAVG